MRKFWKVNALFMLLLFAGCGLNNSPATPVFVLPATPVTTPEEPSLPWSVVTVTQGNLTAVIEAQGELVAKFEEPLFFTLSGLLKHVHVSIGETVTAGDVIAELSAKSLEEQVLIRASELTVAKLQVLNLQAQAVNPPDDDTAEAAPNYTLEIAKERVKLAEARYQYSQQQLESTVLKAPFSGSISSFNLQRGDLVDAYQDVGQIADTSEIRVQVMIPDTVVAMIAPETPAEVWVAGRSYNARVALIDPDSALWLGGPAHRVTITFDEGQDLPNDINNSAAVIIIGETQKNVLLVPVEAVDIFPGQAYVDLVEGSNLRRVPVETGISDGIVIKIMSGLEEGQIVALP